MPLALSQSNPDVGSSPSFCSGRKLGDIEQALLWSLLQEDPQSRAGCYFDEAARRQRPIAVSLRQLNRGGCNGSSIVARDVRVKRHTLGLLSLEQRSSASGPVCRCGRASLCALARPPGGL